MVRHIVLFQLKKTVSESDKLVVMNQFKEAIEALPKDIDVIRKIEVRFNINPAEVFDIALVSEFDSLEDVNFYAKHPLHLAAGKILAEVKENRACVDYEF
ncbi:Dabb family protein [uncultured Bacteroides sp.]|uniref:Dabb family protein n=1 Tax=uncultured Bacteroides sp. TaxID=162156 RepID=UPI002AAA8236|nr:Dabb family protein [uncultured Bacteroides sp.]